MSTAAEMSCASPLALVVAPTPTLFLRSWFAGCPSDQFMELRAFHVQTKAAYQEFFRLDAVAELYGRACSLVEDYHIYFGTAPRIRPKGDKASVTHTPGLWADLDFKRFPDGERGARLGLGAFPIPATWVIGTGGGYHVYWKLREPVQADSDFEARLKGVVKALGADPAATDRCRVLRVPGTFNHKYPECQVRILS